MSVCQLTIWKNASRHGFQKPKKEAIKLWADRLEQRTKKEELAKQAAEVVPSYVEIQIPAGELRTEYKLTLKE